METLHGLKHLAVALCLLCLAPALLLVFSVKPVEAKTGIWFELGGDTGVPTGASCEFTATLRDMITQLPLQGKTITGSITSGGGSLSPTSGTTDSAGVVSFTYTAPTYETTAVIAVSFAGDENYYGSTLDWDITVWNPPPAYYTLSTSVTPPGSGSVSPSSGSYTAGTQVTLAASPSSNYSFTGWGGYLSGTTNPLTFTMPSQDVSVSAIFSLIITPPQENPPTQQVQQTTTISMLSPSFTVCQGESVSLKAQVLIVGPYSLAGKTISWGATAGSLSPTNSVTDQITGVATTAYTAPIGENAPAEVTIAASFAGDSDYYASSGTLTGTITTPQPAELTPGVALYYTSPSDLAAWGAADNAPFSFATPASMLEWYSLGENTVSVYIYSDNGWHKLPTTEENQENMVVDNENYLIYYYSAVLPNTKLWYALTGEQVSPARYITFTLSLPDENITGGRLAFTLLAYNPTSVEWNQHIEVRIGENYKTTIPVIVGLLQSENFSWSLDIPNLEAGTYTVEIYDAVEGRALASGQITIGVAPAEGVTGGGGVPAAWVVVAIIAIAAPLGGLYLVRRAREKPHRRVSRRSG